jgi:hypothetical protein
MSDFWLEMFNEIMTGDVLDMGKQCRKFTKKLQEKIEKSLERADIDIGDKKIRRIYRKEFDWILNEKLL